MTRNSARYNSGMEENENRSPAREEQSSAPEPSYGEQNEDGIDLSLIRENLKLSPSERLEKLQRAAKSLAELRDAARIVRLQG